MAFVATLIANPSNPVLVPAVAERAADAVKALGLYWLADGIACDIAFRDGADLQAAEASILAIISGARRSIWSSRTRKCAARNC